MKLAVVGSRTFTDYEKLKEELDKLDDIEEIITGDAKGTDALAVQYATENAIPFQVICPNREEYKWKGGAIYYQRNEAIWSRSSAGIAFWDGKSRGTKHSFEIAKKQNKELKVVYINGEENG